VPPNAGFAYLDPNRSHPCRNAISIACSLPVPWPLLGASTREGSVGAVVADNLLKSGFRRPVWAVNPKHREIAGTRTLRDVTELPETPDLAMICTPPDVVPGLIDYLGSRGTRAAVVITAGFGEGGDAHGEGLKRAMQDAARHPALAKEGNRATTLMETLPNFKHTRGKN